MGHFYIWECIDCVNAYIKKTHPFSTETTFSQGGMDKLVCPCQSNTDKQRALVHATLSYLYAGILIFVLIMPYNCLFFHSFLIADCRALKITGWTKLLKSVQVLFFPRAVHDCQSGFHNTSQ